MFDGMFDGMFDAMPDSMCDGMPDSISNRHHASPSESCPSVLAAPTVEDD